MGDFINTVDVIGDNELTDNIISRSVAEYYDDSITSIGYNAFRECSALTSVNVPNVTTIDMYAFRKCSNLTSVDLSRTTSFIAQAFNDCTKFNTLVLRSTTICTIAATSVFSLTPFNTSGQGGTVYVPQALIEEYQNATNWSTLYAKGTCNFVAIEGSEYE